MCLTVLTIRDGSRFDNVDQDIKNILHRTEFNRNLISLLWTGRSVRSGIDGSRVGPNRLWSAEPSAPGPKKWL